MPAIASLQIENFRCFEKLRVDGLTRVTLIVGANNSGKTALLEAFEAVASSESPFVLYRASLEREPLPFLLQTRQAISEATMAKIPETEEAFVLTDAAPAVQPAATSG